MYCVKCKAATPPCICHLKKQIGSNSALNDGLAGYLVEADGLQNWQKQFFVEKAYADTHKDTLIVAGFPDAKVTPLYRQCAS